MIEPLVITVRLTRQDIIRARLFVYFRSGSGGALTAAASPVRLTRQNIIRARLFFYFRSGVGVAITVAAILFSLLNGFLATRPEMRSASALPPWFPAFLGLLVIPCAVALGGGPGGA